MYASLSRVLHETSARPRASERPRATKQSLLRRIGGLPYRSEPMYQVVSTSSLPTAGLAILDHTSPFAPEGIHCSGGYSVSLQFVRPIRSSWFPLSKIRERQHHDPHHRESSDSDGNEAHDFVAPKPRDRATDSGNSTRQAEGPLRRLEIRKKSVERVGIFGNL
jgi:hypothetical protein